MPTIPERIMAAVASQVGTVASIGTRIYQGKHRVAETENFENEIKLLTAETQGFFLFWLGPRSLRKVGTALGSCQINAILTFSLPKDESTDCDDAYAMAENVAAVLGNMAVMAAAGAIVNEITYELVNDDLEDGIAEFQFTLNYDTGPNCSQ